MQNPLPPISEQIEFLEESHGELVRLSEDMGEHIEFLCNIVSGAHKYLSHNQDLFDDFHASTDHLNEVLEMHRKTADYLDGFHSKLLRLL